MSAFAAGGGKVPCQPGVQPLDSDTAAGMVSTSDPYSGSSPMGDGAAVFEVQAIGSWSISVR